MKSQSVDQTVGVLIIGGGPAGLMAGKSGLNPTSS